MGSGASVSETRNAVECILHDYGKLVFAFHGERNFAVGAGDVTVLFYLEDNFCISILEDFRLGGTVYPRGVVSLEVFEGICCGLSRALCERVD